MGIRVRQASGRELDIRYLYQEPTYAGHLEGTMTRQHNTLLVAHIAKRMPSGWGQRRVHVVRPAVLSEPDRGQEEWLPPDVFFAWIDSAPINEPFEASELVVVWFGEWGLETTVGALLEPVLRGLDWERLARDYDL